MQRAVKAAGSDGLSDFLREAAFEKVHRDGLLPAAQ